MIQNLKILKTIHIRILITLKKFLRFLSHQKHISNGKSISQIIDIYLVLITDSTIYLINNDQKKNYKIQFLRLIINIKKMILQMGDIHILINAIFKQLR